MLNIFDEHGNLVGNTVNDRVRQVSAQAKQYIECLIDSGATVAETKAFTCTLLEEITWASRQAIIDHDIVLRRKEAEDAKKTN